MILKKIREFVEHKLTTEQIDPHFHSVEINQFSSIGDDRHFLVELFDDHSAPPYQRYIIESANNAIVRYISTTSSSTEDAISLIENPMLKWTEPTANQNRLLKFDETKEIGHVLTDSRDAGDWVVHREQGLVSKTHSEPNTHSKKIDIHL
ncbi:hypothetical protein VCHA53O466_50538 [Vibrio chagasii]|nr:hypothetical protein VCHA53O466_50538 [Vibrio chagasii]